MPIFDHIHKLPRMAPSLPKKVLNALVDQVEIFFKFRSHWLSNLNEGRMHCGLDCGSLFSGALSCCTPSTMVITEYLGSFP